MDHLLLHYYLSSCRTNRWLHAGSVHPVVEEAVSRWLEAKTPDRAERTHGKEKMSTRWQRERCGSKQGQQSSEGGVGRGSTDPGGLI
jgi:hypothetical protein